MGSLVYVGTLPGPKCRTVTIVDNQAEVVPLVEAERARRRMIMRTNHSNRGMRHV